MLFSYVYLQCSICCKIDVFSSKILQVTTKELQLFKNFQSSEQYS